MVVCLIFLFFFFKQKTAYEMRISDWSSDVCSSDLRAFILRAATGGEAVEQSLQSTVVRSVELGAVGLYDRQIGVRPKGDDLDGEPVRDAGVDELLIERQHGLLGEIQSTWRRRRAVAAPVHGP